MRRTALAVSGSKARTVAVGRRRPSGPAPAGGLTRGEEALLRRGGVTPAQFATVRPALREEASRYEALLAGGLTVEEVARRLGVDPSRVRQRLGQRSLYGIKTAEGWLLPRFQFRAAGGAVPGIEKVLERLPGDLSPVAVYRWFTTPNPDLHSRDEEDRPLTPLEWLQTGHPPEAAAALAAEL